MADTPFKVIVNNQESLDVFAADANGLDLVETADGQWHILRNGKSYRVEVLEADYAGKGFKFRINGNIYTASIADRYDQLVSRMGLNANTSNKLREIKAPMPGLVLDIFLSEGQPLHSGDKVLILEAMKMENIIKAAGEGVVKKILVKKGEAVDKGQVLMELEA